MTTQSHNATAAATSVRSEQLTAALLALAFGATLVFTVGFAHPSTIHNAAHDTRHALAFPCH